MSFFDRNVELTIKSVHQGTIAFDSEYNNLQKIQHLLLLDIETL